MLACRLPLPRLQPVGRLLFRFWSAVPCSRCCTSPCESPAKVSDPPCGRSMWDPMTVCLAAGTGLFPLSASLLLPFPGRSHLRCLACTILPNTRPSPSLPLSLFSLSLFSLLSSRSPSRPSLSLCRSRAALFLPVGLSANISARSAFPSFRPFRLQPSFRPQSYFVYLRPAVPSVPDLSVPCLPRVCIAPLRPIVWRPCFGGCGSGGGRVSARARREPSCRCPKVGSGGRWRCCLWRT